jgi:chromosome segregation ATPase
LSESKSKPTDAATVSATEEALRNAKDQIRHVKNELQDCEAAVQDKTKSLSKAEALIKTIAAKHGADIKKYHNKIKDLETQLGASAETIVRLKKEHRNSDSDQTAIASQRRKTEELEGLVASRKKETDDLRKKGGALKDDYERQLSDLRGEFFMKTKNNDHLHKKAIESLQAQLKDERGRLTSQIYALEKEIKCALRDCEQNMKAQFAEQEKTHREILQKERSSSRISLSITKVCCTENARSSRKRKRAKSRGEQTSNAGWRKNCENKKSR